MSWNSRHVWAVGEVLTASNHNSNDADLDYIGREIDYAEITSSVTLSASYTDVITGNPVTYDGSTRIAITAYSPKVVGTDSHESYTVMLQKDGSNLALLADGSSGGVFHAVYFDTPASGSHTYKLRAFTGTGGSGTPTFAAGTGTGGTDAPAFLRITAAKATP